MKHAAGKTYRYDMQIETLGPRVPSGRMTHNMPFRWHIKSVARGTAQIEMSVGSPGSGDAALRMQMDSRGKASNTASGRPFQRMGVHFPVKPLRIGESFRAKATPTMTTFGQASVSDVYTFRGVRKAGSRRVAVLSVRSQVSAKGVNGGGGGTMLIDVADGYLVRYDYRHRFTARIGRETTTLQQIVSAVRK